MARLTPERMQEIERETQEMLASQSQMQNNQYMQTQQAMMMEEKEKSMIDSQLDLDAELMLIENLLRGKILKQFEDGSQRWTNPDDPDLILLTDYGIHLIMNTITFYINKNTLLSHYDLDTINNKMKDLSISLSDVIFMEYEKVFQFPSFEECKKVLLDRITTKTELRKFAIELTGNNPDERAIRNNLLEEIEGRVDGEIQKIKEQKMKNKLKRFDLLIRVVQDAIHSTYLRALFGQERRTLRQHIHVTENLGSPLPQSPQNTFNPLSWVRGNTGR